MALARPPAWVRSPRSSQRALATSARTRARALGPCADLCNDFGVLVAGDLCELEFEPRGVPEARGGRARHISDET